MIRPFTAYAQVRGDARRSISGTVHIEMGAIVFQETGSPRATGPGSSVPISIRMPFDRLRIRQAGAKEDTLLFEHEDHFGTTIWSTDPELRKQLAGQGHRALETQFAEVNRRDRRRRSLLIVLVVAILVFLGGLLSLRAYVLGPFLDRLPPEIERSAGNSLFAVIAAQGDIIEDPLLHDALLPITEPLIQSADNSRYHFQFHILDDKSINAFALPGGNVVLHRGLLVHAEDPEEIAGVVAHEIAHVVRQHSLRALLDHIGTVGLIRMVFGDATGLVAVLSEGGTKLLAHRFSREQEREADRLGLQILHEAGIDPRGLVAFLERIEQLESARSIDRIEFLRTHPSTHERITEAREVIASQAPVVYPGLAVDLDTIRTRLEARTAE